MLSAQCPAADALCCCSRCEPEDTERSAAFSSHTHLICIYDHFIIGFNTAWYTLALKQGMGHIHAEKTFKLEHKRQKQQTEIMGNKT